MRSLAKHEEDANWPEAYEIYKGALRLLEEAKSLNPRYLTCRYNLAQVWFDMEDYPRASEELGGFLQMPMHNSLLESCVGLQAKCLLWVALFKDCIEFSDKWLAKFPSSVSLLRPRAEAIVDGFVMGHVEDEVRVVERSSLEFFESIVKDPTQRMALDFCFLARLKNWMGLTGEALQVLSDAAILFPSAWNVSFHRANILLTRGEVAAAWPFARDSVAKGKWHPPAWELLGAIYDALSMSAEAAASRQHSDHMKAERERLRQKFLR